jgi:Sulfotransferase family
MTQQQIILAVHIPKTGGTTFKNMLLNIYKEEFLKVEGKGIAENVSDDIKLAAEQQAKADRPCVIYGHYYLDPFHAIYPHAQLVVWLRDPAQRLLSNYFYAERSGVGVGHSQEELYKEDNIYKFISQPQHYNTMSKMIGNHKIEEFDFVGLTEEFDKSLELFSAVFATQKLATHPNKIVAKIFKILKRDEVHVKSKNRNPDRKSKIYDISENLHKEIVSLNADDYALFNEGKAYFEKLCKRWLA